MIRIREKADFFGSCQWCGATQKLPGGSLVKHGYTVKWGFFSGICRGSSFLPYEKSCDLVKKSIAEVTEQIKDTQKTVTAVLKATSSQVIANIRTEGTADRRMGYHWTKGEVIRVKDHLGLKYHNYVRNQEEIYEFNFYDFDYAKTIPLGVKAINESYAEHLKSVIKEMKEYIDFQTKRVEAWVQKDLHPVDHSNPYVRPDRPASTRKTYISKSPDGKKEETARTSKAISSAVWGLTNPQQYANNPSSPARWRFIGWAETEKQATAKKKYYDNPNTGFNEYSEVRILPVTGT